MGRGSEPVEPLVRITEDGRGMVVRISLDALLEVERAAMGPVLTRRTEETAVDRLACGLTVNACGQETT